MTHHGSPELDRLYELLADRALQGLSTEEDQLLERLLAKHPDVRMDEFDCTVAQLDVAMAAIEPAPASVRERLRRLELD
jgi:hypothetical protein